MCMDRCLILLLFAGPKICGKADSCFCSKHSTRCCRMSSWMKVSSQRSPRGERCAAAIVKRPQSTLPSCCWTGSAVTIRQLSLTAGRYNLTTAPQYLDWGFLETGYHREEPTHHGKLSRSNALFQEQTEFVQLHVFWRKEELSFVQVQNDLWLK